MIFTVAGGDSRFAILCGLLAADGHEVRAFAMERGKLAPTVHKASSPGAVRDSDCLILPLPVTRGNGVLNAPLCADGHVVQELLDEAAPGTPVCGGLLDAETLELCHLRGLAPTDYFRREELIAANAVATAEGAIGLIMAETPMTLWRSRVLVVGYGRIGRTLAHRLSALGAKVTVSARNYGDLAWIEALGWEALDTRRLEGAVGDFDIVVNTVPAPVLGERVLAGLKPDALCLDLASKPGGVDLEAASSLGVRAIWALGLPGEAAPRTAGQAIKDAVYNILKEQGRMT